MQNDKIAYALRAEDGLYWDGNTYTPKFLKEPHYWSSKVQLERRYRDYLMERELAVRRNENGVESSVYRVRHTDVLPATLTLCRHRILTTVEEEVELAEIAGYELELAAVRARSSRHHPDYGIDAIKTFVRSDPTALSRFTHMAMISYKEMESKSSRKSKKSNSLAVPVDEEVSCKVRGALARDFKDGDYRLRSNALFLTDKSQLALIVLKAEFQLDGTYQLSPLQKLS